MNIFLKALLFFMQESFKCVLSKARKQNFQVLNFRWLSKFNLISIFPADHVHFQCFLPLIIDKKILSFENSQ